MWDAVSIIDTISFCWQVLDLLEDACESLLDSILAENNDIVNS